MRQVLNWPEFVAFTGCLFIGHRVAGRASQRFRVFSSGCSTNLSTEVVSEIIFNGLVVPFVLCLFKRHRAADRTK
jgi:hypothetical protein